MAKVPEREYTRWLKDNLQPIEEIIGEKINNPVCEETSSISNGITRFRVDIKGELESDATPILIEAQYGLTDHRHLGQLITYAAHHGAKKLVWVAEGIRREHFRAVNYINEMAVESNTNVRIFLVRVDFKFRNMPEYKLADENQLYEEKTPGEYKQDNSEKSYWEKFEKHYLPEISGIEFSPGTIKSDYAEVRFGKHYYFNLAIRQGYSQFKVELICANSNKGNGLLANLLSDEENIREQIYANLPGRYDIRIHDRNITITFDADIYNLAKWDMYMELMKNAIITVFDLINNEKYKV